MNILAMALFALSMSITPGPVNVATLSSGISYGFPKTFPFVTGATAGFCLLLLSVGAGASALFSLLPGLYGILRYMGAGYIMYMGLGILRSKGEIGAEERSRPGFYKGFLMQWLNPKAWIACLSGISLFDLKGSPRALFLFTALYFAICYLSISSWSYFGSRMNSLIKGGRALRIVNAVLGAILIGLGVYALAPPFRST